MLFNSFYNIVEKGYIVGLFKNNFLGRQKNIENKKSLFGKRLIRIAGSMKKI